MSDQKAEMAFQQVIQEQLLALLAARSGDTRTLMESAACSVAAAHLQLDVTSDAKHSAQRLQTKPR